MKEDFAQYAHGISARFRFRGNEFLLETEVDKSGNVKTIRLDSETLPLTLRACIQDEAEMMSAGLRAGATIDSIIDTFAVKAGVTLHPFTVLDGNNTKSLLANHIWGAATQILQREYRPEPMFVAPASRRPNPFRVIEGGLA
jgi:hypothetical protein